MAITIPCILAISALPQPIIVPQPRPYTNDEYTVLLEHFDGTTGGSTNGSIYYTNGVFGQGIHLVDGSWDSWNLGSLPQGTVEFWGNLDTLAYGVLQQNFIQSAYGQNFESTFNICLFTNLPS